MNNEKAFTTSIIVFAIMVTFNLSLSAQHQHGGQPKKEMRKDVEKEKVENIVREEEPIDLKAIDKNKDGKLFQDQMDWHVISDKPDKCPLCGMKLVEVTIKQAEENLIKHEFKVKEE